MMAKRNAPGGNTLRTTLCRTLFGIGVSGMAMGILPLAAQQAPKNLQATVVSPTKVKLTWTRGTNASTHRIFRGVPGSLQPIAWVPTPGAAYTDDGATPGTVLVYQVMGKYPNSPNAYSEKIRVTTPAATNTAVVTPPAGSPSASPPAAIPSSPVLLAEPVLRTATLAPVGVATAAPPPATLTPAAPAAATPVTGKYRVVANGFSVIQQGHSHHDDVYGGFIMLHFDRQTGQLKNQDARRTKVLGDINGRVFGETDGGDFKRLRAGTASPTGGLKNGDSYPNAANARIRSPQSAPPNRETFPFEVWTGDLTNNSDAVVILPTLWSRDGKTEPISDWQSAELGATSQIWWDPAVQEGLRGTSLGVISPPGSATPNGSPMFNALVKGLGGAFLAGAGAPWALALMVNPSAFDPSTRDRPIGIDPRARGLPRRAIVLTREMIEQALNGPKAPLSPTMLVPNYPAWMLAYLDVPVGVIPVLLSDYVPPPGEPLRWTYVMYLQVERV
jgi:hypothetical protein